MHLHLWLCREGPGPEAWGQSQAWRCIWALICPGFQGLVLRQRKGQALTRLLIVSVPNAHCSCTMQLLSEQHTPVWDLMGRKWEKLWGRPRAGMWALRGTFPRLWGGCGELQPGEELACLSPGASIGHWRTAVWMPNGECWVPQRNTEQGLWMLDKEDCRQGLDSYSEGGKYCPDLSVHGVCREVLPVGFRAILPTPCTCHYP